MLKENKSKRSNKMTKLSWIVLAIFVVGGMYSTISTANAGAKLANLEEIEARVVAKNQVLKRELVDLNSLTSLEVRAQVLGYNQPERLIYLTQDEEVAKVH